MADDDHPDDQVPDLIKQLPLKPSKRFRGHYSHRRGEANSAADKVDAAPNSAQPEKRDGWQIRQAKELLKKEFPPDGLPPLDLKLKAIRKRLERHLAKGLPLPSRDTIARALGRRRSK